MLADMRPRWLPRCSLVMILPLAASSAPVPASLLTLHSFGVLAGCKMKAPSHRCLH